MPFCHVSRLTTPNSGPGLRDAEVRAQRVAARAARDAMPRVERRGQVRVGGRIPRAVVDAVADAAQRVRAMAKQPVEPHAALGCLDLLGIRRRHGGDAVGELQSGLEIADAAVVLDALDDHACHGKPRLSQLTPPNCPWNAMLCTVITVRGRGRSA